MIVQGFVAPGFEGVRDAFEHNFAEGLEVGASLAIRIDGKPVIDLWGGEDGAGAPWCEDTVVNVFSTTKTIAALVVLLLIDRGVLDAEAPVARWWPEFAANGKAHVLLRHLLGHSAGVAGWDAPMTAADLFDWNKACSLLAAQSPWWEPGSAPGYHAVTQGFLLDEVVRRATGKTIGAILTEELADPLGADFHIGLPSEQDHRVATLIAPPVPETPPVLPPDSLAARIIGNPSLSADLAMSTQWRRAELAAGNGHGNARAVAALLSVLACDGFAQGRRYMSEASVDLAFKLETEGTDRVALAPVRMSHGFALPSASHVFGRGNRVCFWGGWGGSLAIVDATHRMAFSYVMNRMLDSPFDDPRNRPLVEATYDALERLPA